MASQVAGGVRGLISAFGNCRMLALVRLAGAASGPVVDCLRPGAIVIRRDRALFLVPGNMLVAGPLRPEYRTPLFLKRYSI